MLALSLKMSHENDIFIAMQRAANLTLSALESVGVYHTLPILLSPHCLAEIGLF